MAIPPLAFNTPFSLSLHETLDLQINPTSLRSDLPIYQDSIFDVVFRKESGVKFCVVTRLRVPSPPATPSLSSKRELIVSELPPTAETLKKIEKAARQWYDLSYRKKWEKEDSAFKAIFEDLSIISRNIVQCMEDPETTKRMCLWNKIFICEDVALKELQAIALVYDNPIHRNLSHIVTHPHNVRAPVNASEKTRVEGAARAIVNYLAKTLPPLLSGIYLDSLTSAMPFYLKLGFEELGSQKPSPSGSMTKPLLLSAEKIQRLISKAA